MSDPVTNAEVEDVLSSIRRLVSEEKRPVPAAIAVPQSDRLVLTPSLRVEDEVLAEDEQGGTATFQSERSDAQEPAQNSESAGTYKLENPQLIPDDSFADDTSEETDVQAASEGTAEDDYAPDPYNFDLDDDLDGESDAVLHLTPDARSDVSQTDVDRVEPADEPTLLVEDDQVVDMPVQESKAATLSAKIEALESAIGGIEDDFEPDEAGTDAYAGTDDPTMSWEDEPAEQDLSARARAEDDFEEAEGDFEEQALADLSLDQDGIESDLTNEDLEKLTPEKIHIMEDRIEEAVVAAAAAQTQQDDQPFVFVGDDRVIDEEALRDMVGEIVRSELQGALGERITRNVRKLVRREIHRAMTTQDLE